MPVELGLLAAELGHGLVAVHPLTRDPVPVGTSAELGEDGEREVIVRAGEVLVIPSNLPHRAIALEDTLDVDVFNPPRQDWLSGNDAYLRR